MFSTVYTAGNGPSLGSGSDVSTPDGVSDVDVDALLDSVVAVPCSPLVVSSIELMSALVVVVFCCDVESELSELAEADVVCGPVLVLPLVETADVEVDAWLMAEFPADVVCSFVELDV